MALVTRLSRLFKADFHAVLDQVEEPLLLLKQAVREMEEEIDAAELRQRQALMEKDKLGVRRLELAQSLAEIEDELDICFEEDESGLARDLIRRKLQAQRLLKRVESRLATIETDYHSGQQDISENRATLESMRQKIELFDQRSPVSVGAQYGDEVLDRGLQDLGVGDNDVEVAFLREKKRRVQS